MILSRSCRDFHLFNFFHFLTNTCNVLHWFWWYKIWPIWILLFSQNDQSNWSFQNHKSLVLDCSVMYTMSFFCCLDVWNGTLMFHDGLENTRIMYHRQHVDLPGTSRFDQGDGVNGLGIMMCITQEVRNRAQRWLGSFKNSMVEVSNIHQDSRWQLSSYPTCTRT